VDLLPVDDVIDLHLLVGVSLHPDLGLLGGQGRRRHSVRRKTAKTQCKDKEGHDTVLRVRTKKATTQCKHIVKLLQTTRATTQCKDRITISFDIVKSLIFCRLLGGQAGRGDGVRTLRREE
jgi:hypothetical protein